MVGYFCIRCLQARARHSCRPCKDVIIARAKSPAWFYVGVVGVATSAMLLAVSLVFVVADKNYVSDILVQYAFCSFSVGFLYSWLGAYQVRVSRSSVEYWSLFSGYQSLLLKEIGHVRVKHSWSSAGDQQRGAPILLELIPTHNSNLATPIAINTKVLGKIVITRLLARLSSITDFTGS